MSASSLSKPSKFLTLQFLVKSCKFHSVFKIPSKSRMLEMFVLQSLYLKVCTSNFHINYDFILSKSLNSPNLYINWANMWHSEYQNKKFSLFMQFQGFSFKHQISLMWYMIINLGKKSICTCYCKQIKTSFARIK